MQGKMTGNAEQGTKFENWLARPTEEVGRDMESFTFQIWI